MELSPATLRVAGQQMAKPYRDIPIVSHTTDTSVSAGLLARVRVCVCVCIQGCGFYGPDHLKFRKPFKALSCASHCSCLSGQRLCLRHSSMTADVISYLECLLPQCELISC